VSEEIITLAQFDRPIDAHLARTRLESAGIPVIVINDGISNLTVYHAVETGLVRLQVRASDREQALEILGVEQSEPQTPEQCPQCQSSNVKHLALPFPRLILHLLVGVWMHGLARRRHRCQDCGAAW